MPNKRVVIIGAVALGPKVACRLKRLQPDADVIMVDQDEHISYGGCGIPYFISGDVSDVKELMSTSFHMVRDAQFFEHAKGVQVRPRTRAIAIDRQNQKVLLESLETGQREELSYDQLVLATGSRPARLRIPGIDLPQVMSVANLRSAMAIKDRIAQGQVDKAVIIGAGAIGCEMAEALSDLWGVQTTLVEIADQVLPGIVDPTLARIIQKNLKDHEVELFLSETVVEIRSTGDSGNGVEVLTSRRTLEADLVISAVGVQPCGELAREAGLLVSPRGAVVVNRRLQTSDPNIYAGGDCIENLHLITGKPAFFPQGSLANRHGRVIGTNLAGGMATFPGIVGSFVVKIFDLAVASTGLTLAAAQREGFDALQTLVIQADRAHFYPGQDLMYLQLVMERKTRRVLGLQGVSHQGDALVGRINAVAALLPHRPTLEDLSNLEVAYSPPFAAALDILNAVANTAENTLDGFNRTMDADEFERCFLQDQEEDVVCLDVRGPANATPFVEHFGGRWINIPQETLNRRLDEIPRDKRVVIVCNSGVRSYEALRQLDTAGGCQAVNLQGGVAILKKTGMIDLSEDAESEP
ncbi:MAG TPA: pyridine nucleotide-disulfide oxidoreductase [Syntrophobacteraceae bacterium]|nr:pyridine nucleotide-disulfide oxidoreductase [Syntrophobacteraceae bacterium]HBZ56193.1 pyridine nucleotide-disulfide oxidoreductase [Syntrophobacteraceae bacterium]